MKNVNYNVIKLLHSALDSAWRIEKHYIKDAKGSKCGCGKLLKGMRADLERHVESLKKELGAHHKMNKLA